MNKLKSGLKSAKDKVVSNTKKIILLAVILWGLTAYYLVENSRIKTITLSGTCQGTQGEIVLVDAELEVIDNLEKEYRGVLLETVSEITCKKSEIEINSKTYKTDIINSNSKSYTRQVNNEEFISLKKLEKQKFLIEGICENDKIEDIVILQSVDLKKRVITLHLTSVFEDEMYKCDNEKVSIQKVDPDFINSYRINNKINIEGLDALMTGICMDNRENTYELVNSRVSIISYDEKRAIVGSGDNKVILTCNFSQTGKVIFKPLVKIPKKK